MKVFRWIRNTVLIAALAALPGATFAHAQISIGISITTAPPALPVYVQPVCPAPNYIWTPGYWAWGTWGYYWVPGTWVPAPSPGLLWTPGYWGWANNVYAWHGGYWGPQVGFYGGVNYGFGYGGVGYGGGRWVGNSFSYNTAVMNVNRTVIRNTYIDRTVIVNNNVNRVSFNGGHGGIQARPTPAQMTAERQKRFGPIDAQTRQVNLARDNRENYAAANHGLPPHAALQRPATSAADFNRAVAARGARPASELRTAAANLKPVSPATRPAARPEQRPAARPETKPAARPETRPTTRPNEARPAAKPAARPEARPQAKPAQHQAAKPHAKPESKPREEKPQGN